MADGDPIAHPCERCAGLPGTDGCPVCHGTGLARPLGRSVSWRSTKTHAMYLSRQHDGNYMLTALRPKPQRVRGGSHDDLYFQNGEPVGVRHLCPLGTRAIFGEPAAAMRPLDVRRVRVMGWVEVAS